MCVNKWCYDCCLYIFLYLYSRNVQVPCPGHTPQLSGLSLQDGDLEVFIVSEKEEFSGPTPTYWAFTGVGAGTKR